MQQKLEEIFAEIFAKVSAKHENMVNRLRDHIPQWASQLTQMFESMRECGYHPVEILNQLRVGLMENNLETTAKPTMFRQVPLPEGLTNGQLEEAMNYTAALIAAINRDMREGIGEPLSRFIQANNFSGIVSNIFTDAMDKFSHYKHNHDQRYPDLKNAQGIGLEMKAANRAGKGGESHNAHGGWHLIACFHLDQATGDIRFVQIEVAELVSYRDEPDGDWRYCGSRRNDQGSQRTETYYTTSRGTWKLRDGSAYLDTDVVNISRWRRGGGAIPAHSPFLDRAPRH